MKGKDLMKGVGQSVGNASKASLPNGEKLSEKVNQNKNKFAQASRDASNASKSKNNGEVDEENQEGLAQEPKGKTKTGLPDTQGLGTAAAKEALKKAADVVPYTKWIPKGIRDKIIDKFMDSKLGQAMVEKEIKRIKMQLILIIVSAVASVLFSLFMLCAILTLILAPVAWVSDVLSDIGGFFVGLGNWFSGNGWCTSEGECQADNEKKYYDKLKKEVERHNSNDINCPINADLITATIFYGQMVDEKKESDEEDGKIRYYNYVDVQESETWSPTAHSKIDGLISVYARGGKTEETDENGKYICEKNIEKYRQYLIDTYIMEFYPSVVNERRTIEEVADEIIEMGNEGIGGDSQGDIIISGGTAGPIPQDVLQNINNPVGTQSLNHTSCFGFYNSSKCQQHNGIDIGGSGATDPKIYSIADGVIDYVSTGNDNCLPDFSSDNVCHLCTGSVTGNKVRIKHTMDINGTSYIFYSEYLHLKSVDVSRNENVVKGQQIGIMGNTGCSSGVHLHFSMLDEQFKRYNPEEVLKQTNADLISDCEAIRKACNGGKS